MNRGLVNVSNHPVASWSDAQVVAACDLARGGSPQDFVGGFPQIPPHASTEEVDALAADIAARVSRLAPAAVHVAGEFTCTYAIVLRLQRLGIPCYAATTKRIVSLETAEDGAQVKRATFEFVNWRQYPLVRNDDANDAQ